MARACRLQTLLSQRWWPAGSPPPTWCSSARSWTAGALPPRSSTPLLHQDTENRGITTRQIEKKVVNWAGTENREISKRQIDKKIVNLAVAPLRFPPGLQAPYCANVNSTNGQHNTKHLRNHNDHNDHNHNDHNHNDHNHACSSTFFDYDDLSDADEELELVLAISLAESAPVCPDRIALQDFRFGHQHIKDTERGITKRQIEKNRAGNNKRFAPNNFMPFATFLAVASCIRATLAPVGESSSNYRSLTQAPLMLEDPTFFAVFDHNNARHNFNIRTTTPFQATHDAMARRLGVEQCFIQLWFNDRVVSRLDTAHAIGICETHNVVEAVIISEDLRPRSS